MTESFRKPAANTHLRDFYPDEQLSAEKPGETEPVVEPKAQADETTNQSESIKSLLTDY